MSVEAFLEYLFKHEPTAQLAAQLAQVHAVRARIEDRSVAAGGSGR